MSTPSNAPKGKLVRALMVDLPADPADPGTHFDWAYSCTFPHPLGSDSSLTQTLSDADLDQHFAALPLPAGMVLRNVVQARSNEGLRIAVVAVLFDSRQLQAAGVDPALMFSLVCEAWRAEEMNPRTGPAPTGEPVDSSRRRVPEVDARPSGTDYASTRSAVESMEPLRRAHP